MDPHVARYQRRQTILPHNMWRSMILSKGIADREQILSASSELFTLHDLRHGLWTGASPSRE